MSNARTYDVILWGATGFTGRLVAEYLSTHTRPGQLRWAMAGRNLSRLEEIRRELCSLAPAAADIPLIVGDSHDQDSLEKLAAQTRVVCTTVGPYARYGNELVAACVNQGTDYCDLTGEVQWIRRMIDMHHDRARERGARIIHCCGFDSIPSDLGCLMMVDAMTDRDASCDRVDAFVVSVRGGPSGGTAASLLNVLDEVRKDPAIRKVLGHPYGLNPENHRTGPNVSDPHGVGRSKVLPGWTAPFVMAAINTRIVRRSNVLLDFRYGREFVYQEQMGFPDNVGGFFKASGMSAGLLGFTASAFIPPTRSLLERFVLPKPGEGPSKEERDAGHFRIVLVAQGTDKKGQPVTARGRVEGQSDPGYGETSKMLAETALCLALERDELPSVGGSLTPASAMGQRLTTRLRNAGMVFTVDS